MSYDVPAAVAAPAQHPAPRLSPYSRLAQHLGVRRLDALLAGMADRLDRLPEVTVSAAVSKFPQKAIVHASLSVATPGATYAEELPL